MCRRDITATLADVFVLFLCLSLGPLMGCHVLFLHKVRSVFCFSRGLHLGLQRPLVPPCCIITSHSAGCSWLWPCSQKLASSQSLSMRLQGDIPALVACLCSPHCFMASVSCMYNFHGEPLSSSPLGMSLLHFSSVIYPWSKSACPLTIWSS